VARVANIEWSFGATLDPIVGSPLLRRYLIGVKVKVYANNKGASEEKKLPLVLYPSYHHKL
jgi:hypothetical protein